MHTRTKQEVSEESAIKEELKVVETALKKTKKSVSRLRFSCRSRVICYITIDLPIPALKLV